MKDKIKITVSFTDDIAGLPLKIKEVRELLIFVSECEKTAVASLDVLFVGAEHIRALNIRFLNHDYETDVITFPLHTAGESIEGEIYICAHVAEKQAVKFNVPYREELMRLIIHGMLHLAGYNDAKNSERKIMMDLGEKYLDYYCNNLYAKK